MHIYYIYIYTYQYVCICTYTHMRTHLTHVYDVHMHIFINDSFLRTIVAQVCVHARVCRRFLHNDMHARTHACNEFAYYDDILHHDV